MEKRDYISEAEEITEKNQTIINDLAIHHKKIEMSKHDNLGYQQDIWRKDMLEDSTIRKQIISDFQSKKNDKLKEEEEILKTALPEVIKMEEEVIKMEEEENKTKPKSYFFTSPIFKQKTKTKPKDYWNLEKQITKQLPFYDKITKQLPFYDKPNSTVVHFDLGGRRKKSRRTRKSRQRKSRRR